MFKRFRDFWLSYTKLEKPDKITKCPFFDSLEPRAQSKKYEWEKPCTPGYCCIRVKYRKYLSNRVDNYIDYPSNNGYVFSIDYYDSYGNSHSLDMLDLMLNR